MAEVVLIPKKEIDIKLEAEAITPDAFAGKSAEEIGKLEIWQGPKTYPLAEFFDVERIGEDFAGEWRSTCSLTSGCTWEAAPSCWPLS